MTTRSVVDRALERSLALGLAVVFSAGCSSSLPPDESPGPSLATLDRRAREGDVSIASAILEGLDSEDPGIRAHRYALLVAVWGFHCPGAPAPVYDPWAPRVERLERIEEMRPVLERLRMSGASAGGTAWSGP